MVLPPHNSSFLVRAVIFKSSAPQKFSKNCGQSGYIALHPFSSIVEGAIPNYERRDAYIQNWLKVLRDDKRFIVSASGRAEKAVNLILGSVG